MSFVAPMTVFATDLVLILGYGGLAVGLAVGCAGVPVPSEVILPLAGALVRQGRFDLTVVITVAVIAQTAGAVMAYFLGASGGLPLVKRYGKYVLFSERKLMKTQAWFDRHGTWLTFIGRCIPIIRAYVGYPAGLARMPIGRFVIASFAGSLVWSVFLVLLGYLLADRLEVIDAVMQRYGLIVVGVLLGGVVWYVWRKKRQLV